MSVYARQSSKLKNFTEYLYPTNRIVSSGTDVAETENEVWYVPISVPFPVTIDALIFLTGNVGAGNVYAAVYTDNALAPLNRLVVSASTALTGADKKQIIPLTKTRLQQGIVWAALEKSAALDKWNEAYTGKSQWYTGIASLPKVYKEAMGAYLAPPAVATPVEVVMFASDSQPYLILRVSEC